ncbi:MULTISPECIES: acyl carrier protein [unclassified Gemella]|uniref:acyl carrier protein n=1 Tax=unclassified Gemella TaxID=2624949 RepID=UPI0010739E9B|nr:MULTISPECIES: acyl carrier protein [unclassified Gemella]MBF0710231.1 acyl carrier protein [Gemella sp. GL1.1]MBF0746531.1 acyl carrier protein [Gemella sp. 19428wG2_WT2a]NYS27575.1 acyl carrier protein [Gemella sp. GL1]TFU60309.1 acyl carrier protein [Gemella sp. WT2a]
MTVLDELKEIIIRHTGVEAETITLDARFNEDLSADSIEIAEIVMDIEEKYDFEFSDEDATKIKKISDLVEYVEKSL